MIKYRTHMSIEALRELTRLSKRQIPVKDGLMRVAIGENDQGQMQYTYQPGRKFRRMLAAKKRRSDRV